MEVIKEFIGFMGSALFWKSALHFLSSGLVGLLVYWWTSTTLFHTSSGQKILKLPMGVSGIHHFSLLLAVLFAIWFHILEDLVVDWF